MFSILMVNHEDGFSALPVLSSIDEVFEEAASSDASLSEGAAASDDVSVAAADATSDVIFFNSLISVFFADSDNDAALLFSSSISSSPSDSESELDSEMSSSSDVPASCSLARLARLDHLFSSSSMS